MKSSKSHKKNPKQRKVGGIRVEEGEKNVN